MPDHPRHAPQCASPCTPGGITTRRVGHLARRPKPFDSEGQPQPLEGWRVEDEWRLTRRLRAVRRGLCIGLWTLVSAAVQAVLLLFRGAAKVVFARFYWAVFSRLLGFQVQVIGTVASSAMARPVVFVSNHSSWVDIAILGGVLDAPFVAKGDIAHWPVIRSIARLGRTVFVSRQRGATGRERDAMRARLASGDNLILFPEGTSSDGSRVLPFRSSFFSLAETPGSALPPLIQPISLVYDRLGWLPAGRASRPVFAWYGDMDIASHFWRLAQRTGLRATVLLHKPVDPARFADRKLLAQAIWRTVDEGAATLRQNRPATPLDVCDTPEAASNRRSLA